MQDTSEEIILTSLFEGKLSGGKDKEIRVDLEINGHSMLFTFDTSSAVSNVLSKVPQPLALARPTDQLGFTGQLTSHTCYHQQRASLPHWLGVNISPRKTF